MNCRHDMLAYLGRRGLRDQPSLKLLVGGDPRTEKWRKNLLQKRGSILSSCIPECLKKKKTKNPPT